MEKINNKISSAYQKYQSSGLSGLVMLYPRRLYNRIIRLDRFWGNLVELRGDVVKIDGLKFIVVPTISKKEKGKFLFDRYERPERIAIKQFFNPSEPVIEFGGNIGVVSCIINRKLIDPEKHVVVEANPDLIPFLEKNRQHNKCQFQILNSAVAHGVDEVSFNISDNILASSVQTKGERSVTVSATTLESILEKYKFPTCTLVCDIEGGEIELIEYESEIIKKRISTLFVEVHAKFTGQEAVDNLINKLKKNGFEIVFNRWSNIVFQNLNMKTKISYFH